MFPTLTVTDLNSIFLEGVRWLFYIAFGLYLLFTLVALRQIELMRKTVVTPFSGVVMVIGILHVVGAVLGLVFAVVVLR